MVTQSHGSEIARIREQIALEYEAANRVFTDFTPTAKHEYITQRQLNIAICFQDLSKYMKPEDAMGIILEIENGIIPPAVLPN